MGFVLPVIVAVIGVWIAFSIVVWATGRDTLLDITAAGPPLGLGEGESVDETAVASVKFDTGLRGYRTDQVDAALNRLAWEIGRRDEMLAEMRSQLDGTAEPDPSAEAALRLAGEDESTPDGPATDADASGSEAGREGGGETAPRGEA
ncbi:DivIVA domain-containing protein [Glycomyces sp. YM15]|uniref:DivIVA domain-containing protein n=1 Tax=Glycomyces sp. YM15 TaxID=2800446 RepID=UPI0019629757|nr:DivIVA domain-containing protein [Glycomyces sp. YM15]